VKEQLQFSVLVFFYSSSLLRTWCSTYATSPYFPENFFLASPSISQAWWCR